jgi:hypothetical protein
MPRRVSRGRRHQPLRAAAPSDARRDGRAYGFGVQFKTSVIGVPLVAAVNLLRMPRPTLIVQMSTLRRPEL